MPPTPSLAPTSVPPAAVWKPLLVRGLVAAVFGLATVFWQQPSELGAGLATALYLLATAATVLWLRTAQAAASRGIRRALSAETAYLVLVGLLVLVMRGPVAYSTVVGLGLFAVGATALAVGWRERRESQLAKDWLTTGAVSLATGLLLPFFIPMGTKALLGVVGGSAIILAVLLLLAGLSYRHDGAQPGAEAVN